MYTYVLQIEIKRMQMYTFVCVRILQYIFSIINDDFIAKMALYDCQNWLKLRDYSENVEILDKMKI